MTPHRVQDPVPDEEYEDPEDLWMDVDEPWEDVPAEAAETTTTKTVDVNRPQTVEERREAVSSINGGLNPPEEQIKLQQETTENLRHLRKILDQSLIREGQIPVMGVYDQAYPNDGFTVD